MAAKQIHDEDIQVIAGHNSPSDLSAGKGRIGLSLHQDAAKALDDSLTQGKGRERGKPLTDAEAALRKAVRKVLAAIERAEKKK